MKPPTREELIDYLVRTGIAGQVKTPRENNLKHYRKLAEGDPYLMLGLTLERDWSFADILAVMAKRCGVVGDENYRWGVDTIDPERTVDTLDVVGERLAEAVRDRERVMFVTGHPMSLLETYQTWRSAVRARGVPVVTGGAGHSYRVDGERGARRRVVEWEHQVGYVSDGHEPRHSHHPDGMRAILDDLALRGEPWPDLVIADHGFAGAAAEAGLDVVGFADCNDPALFVAEAEGRVRVSVPLDDGYQPSSYRPLAAYVLARAGLRAG